MKCIRTVIKLDEIEGRTFPPKRNVIGRPSRNLRPSDNVKVEPVHRNGLSSVTTNKGTFGFPLSL